MVELRQQLADQQLRRLVASRRRVTGPERFSVQRLRVQRQAVLAQSAERVVRLRAHLTGIAEDALTRPDAEGEASEKALSALANVSSQASLNQLDLACRVACSLCKGDCCLGGEERLAYLTAGTIRNWRKRRPEASADEIVSEYLSYVPRKATASGCFYQAGSGCTLPREMRSEVCNRYFCDGLQRFSAETCKSRTQAVGGAGAPMPVRAFFVVTLPNGRRQTRFHESLIE